MLCNYLVKKMEDSLNEVIITTQQNCMRLNEEIKKCRKILIEKTLNTDITPPSAQDVVSTKLAKLQIELEQEVEDELQAPLHHPLAVSTLLLRELEEVIDQTDKLVQIARARCTSLDKDIEEKENLVLEQNKLEEALLDRLQSQPDPPSEAAQSQFIDSYNEELLGKRQLSENLRRDVKKQMKNFVNRHFATPKTSRPDTSSVDDVMLLERVLPFNHLLDDLITLSIRRSEDPYLTIGAQHWPPHIELLLSRGLASRHPTNINRVKLCDLHL